jgi:hypothetical protein
MSVFHLTESEFADVQRLVSSYELTPLYGRREAARSLVQTIGEINDKARARSLHEKFEEDNFERKPNVNAAKVPPAR